VTGALQADSVREAVGLVDRALRAHGGGAHVAAFGDDIQDMEESERHIQLRLTGLCTGCPYWPVTLGVTIEPLLSRELGPVTVSIEGKQVSESTKKRLTLLARHSPLFDSINSDSEVAHDCDH